MPLSIFHQRRIHCHEGFAAKNVLAQFEDETDVGTVHRPGSCEYQPISGVYIIAGSGANIWGEQDAFHFVWKRMQGNFIVTVRATFFDAGVNPHRKLGWMARTSLDAGSSHVSTGIHGDGLLSLQFRRTRGGPTEEVRSALTGADVVQLERKSNTFIM
jgi:TolB protein